MKRFDAAHASRDAMRLPAARITLSIVHMFDRIRSLISPVLLAALWAPAVVAAVEDSRRVAHVPDGGSLDVLVDTNRMRIRLAGIEPPAEGQAYSLRARQSLIAICGGELATLKPAGKDRAGTAIAYVTCNGRDASAEQVRLGLARVNAGAVPSLRAVEAEAKAARRGIWAPK